MAKREIIRPEELPFECQEVPLKVTRMGAVTEVQMVSRRSRGSNIKRLDKDNYIDLQTGEVKQFNHGQNRKDNERALLDTFKRLRSIINANTEYPERCRWITLTYAENMTDEKRLYKDFEKFNKRFQYWNTGEGREKAEYIAVVEPQARGAWHFHLLYIWDKAAPFVENQKLAELWGHGFVKITALDTNCDNIGAYLTAYLADIPIEEADGIGGEIKEVNGKRYVKGGRLSMYPVGMNLYRTSRGIKRAAVEYSSPKKLGMEDLGKLTYRRTIKLTFEDLETPEKEAPSTYIDTRYYNKKRK